MNNDIRVEKWNGYDIRFVDHNGEWWAVAKDVIYALGLKQVTKALYTLKENEIALADLTNSNLSSNGGT